MLADLGPGPDSSVAIDTPSIGHDGRLAIGPAVPDCGLQLLDIRVEANTLPPGNLPLMLGPDAHTDGATRRRSRSGT